MYRVVHVPSGTEDNGDRKSTRLNSSHVEISYAVFCLKKKNKMRLPQKRNVLCFSSPASGISSLFTTSVFPIIPHSRSVKWVSPYTSRKSEIVGKPTPA